VGDAREGAAQLAFEPGPAETALVRAVSGSKGETTLIGLRPHGVCGQNCILRAVSNRRRALRRRWSRTYRLGSHDVLAVANGAGSLRAASALDAVADTFLPDAVISTASAAPSTPNSA